MVPMATFIEPEVARVGINEQDAKEQNIPYELTKYGIDDLDRAIADSTAYGFVKVLTVPGKDRILGTMHTYPTLAEANKYAARAWKRAHAPQKVLVRLDRFHAWRRG